MGKFGMYKIDYKEYDKRFVEQIKRNGIGVQFKEHLRKYKTKKKKNCQSRSTYWVSTII